MGNTQMAEEKRSLIHYFLENIRRTGKSPFRVLSGFFVAWVLFFLFWKVLPPFQGLTPEGMAVLGIVVWASIMWVSEAMPLVLLAFLSLLYLF